MLIRNTLLSEIDVVMAIYDDARSFMRKNGNMNQWTGGFPQRELICDDIKKGISYVVTDESNNILAVFAYFEGTDPTYLRVYNGAWLNSDSYGVIHRIAVSAHGKGVAAFVYEHCFNKCGNLKIDTHADNIPMQKSLLKNGFIYCGIIHLLNGDERYAYQKIS